MASLRELSTIENNEELEHPVFNFLKDNVSLLDGSLGFVPFDPNNVQKEIILNTLHCDKTYHVAPRQSGTSTAIMGLILSQMMAGEMEDVLLLGPNYETAKNNLCTFAHMVESMSKLLVLRRNNSDITLLNKSTISAASLEDFSHWRGTRRDTIFLDNYYHRRKYEEVMARISYAIPDGKIILASFPEACSKSAEIPKQLGFTLCQH